MICPHQHGELSELYNRLVRAKADLSSLQDDIDGLMEVGLLLPPDAARWDYCGRVHSAVREAKEAAKSEHRAALRAYGEALLAIYGLEPPVRERP